MRQKTPLESKRMLRGILAFWRCNNPKCNMVFVSHNTALDPGCPNCASVAHRVDKNGTPKQAKVGYK